MTIKSAYITQKKSDGTPWDAAPPRLAPDPFVKVYVDNQEIYDTSVIKDTTSPNWNESFSFSYEYGQNIKIEVWDKDLWDDDLIGNWHGTSLPDEELRFGNVRVLYITIR
jgi:Ca2+-dependent lipid-binding protein